jgi:hypothetical protein
MRDRDYRFVEKDGNAYLIAPDALDDGDGRPLRGPLTAIITILLLVTWIAGIVLAKGWLSTLIAVCFPFWAWYLLIEKALLAIGWL